MNRTKNEQERYDLGVQFARDVYKHGKSGIINRGDLHFDAGARDEYVRIDDCHKHADEWEALAEEQDMMQIREALTDIRADAAETRVDVAFIAGRQGIDLPPR